MLPILADYGLASLRATSTPSAPQSKPPRTLQVVILDGNPMHDWCGLFEGQKLSDGTNFRVVQASWMETAVTYYHKAGGAMMTIAPVKESENKVLRPSTLVVRPDFLIVRNQVRGPTPVSDKRSVLYGLMMANVPSINSLHSIYMNLERPCMFAELKKIEDRVGHAKFPLIRQNYYSSHKQMIIPSSLPGVIKVSHAHAGMGKIRIATTEQFRDLATVLEIGRAVQQECRDRSRMPSSA
eukprot:TRINITY_DN8283_c0_g1_i3.p1 TRINITY_DN8283_c0_g1~~TRINITY_DN8283_c0_g1_i3.p1  ORF type:complete len:239 (-),score=22.72 TRINITY_DN8283_c0_g1_i3:11-727(-)